MIKTVVFDIGNVLVDVDFKGFSFRCTDDPAIAKRVMDATVHSGVWSELDRGCLSDEEVIQKFVDKDPEIEKEIRGSMANTTGLITPKKESLPMILGLKKAGYQVLALSNYPKSIHEENPEALCFLDAMDGYILSYKEGVVKPETEIYERLRSRYGFKASECVFIDDLITNLDAADDLGWHTIHYTSYEQVKKELLTLGVHFEAVTE